MTMTERVRYRIYYHLDRLALWLVGKLLPSYATVILDDDPGSIYRVIDHGRSPELRELARAWEPEDEPRPPCDCPGCQALRVWLAETPPYYPVHEED